MACAISAHRLPEALRALEPGSAGAGITKVCVMCRIGESLVGMAVVLSGARVKRAEIASPGVSRRLHQQTLGQASPPPPPSPDPNARRLFTRCRQR
jgi:hypothetical protein